MSKKKRNPWFTEAGRRVRDVMGPLKWAFGEEGFKVCLKPPIQGWTTQEWSIWDGGDDMCFVPESLVTDLLNAHCIKWISECNLQIQYGRDGHVFGGCNLALFPLEGTTLAEVLVKLGNEVLDK